MGIIKAIFDAASGSLADSWLEVIEADSMGDTTVFTKGVKVRRNDKRNSNKKGTEDVISNGSVIHVYPGQFMMLVDGGKIIACGNHEALMESSKIYREIYDAQTKGKSEKGGETL